MVRRALIHFQGHPISLLRNPCCEIALEIMLRTKTESPAKFRYALAAQSCSISKDFTVCFTRSYDDKSKTWTLVKLMRSVAIARAELPMPWPIIWPEMRGLPWRLEISFPRIPQDRYHWVKMAVLTENYLNGLFWFFLLICLA